MALLVGLFYGLPSQNAHMAKMQASGDDSTSRRMDSGAMANVRNRVDGKKGLLVLGRRVSIAAERNPQEYCTLRLVT